MNKPNNNKESFSYKFEKYLHEVGISNDELFNCLNSILDFSGAKSVKQYAEERGKSVQSVYQYKKTRTILGKKVVFDNL